MKPPKFVLSSIILFFIVAFSSCKKIDLTPLPDSEFLLNGETFSISKGFVEKDNISINDTYNYRIFLTSSEIYFSRFEFTGTGNIIYLSMNSSSMDYLLPGKYNFSEKRLPFTFSVGNVKTNYDFEFHSGNTIEIVEGSVDISSAERGINIELDLILSDNTTMTGILTVFLDVI